MPPEPSLRRAPRSVESDGPDAAELSSGYKLVPDEWQKDWIDISLARRKGGRFSAATCCLCVPRQNGKNGALEVRELYGMVVLGEKFLHTAHEVKTSRKAFKRICSFFENERQFPELAALATEIRKTNGQEAILLSNGGSIEFIARSSGSGRGFTVDVLVCDEVQDLTDDELAALLPTISAAPLGNPQVILTGTPPDPEKQDAAKGEVIRRVRAEAQAGTDPNLGFVDYGVPDGPLPDVDDRALWYRVNPALGGRLNIAEVVRERKLMSPEKFARERLGWWGDPAKDKRGPISLTEWADLLVTADPPTRACLVVDVAPNRRRWSIGVAADYPDGRTLLIVKTGANIADVVPALVKLDAEQNIVEIALDERGQAGALIPDIEAAGLEYEKLNTTQMGQACAAFQTGVPEKRYAHVGQTELSDAIAGLTTRFVGEVELWDRRDQDRSIDISPVVAVSAAAYRWAKHAGMDYDPLDSIG